VCGIAGKLDFAGPVNEELLRRMCLVMEHRGPDSRGIHVADGVGLAVQRLAIIDVAGGDQPIFNEDGTVALVMNGEIYNHRELREALVDRGHRFASRADTEVVLHLYEEHGDELVHRLRGMFAFAIWDRRRRRLLCGRDRVGKKPLFYARRGSRFWFASEVRSILQDPEIQRDVDPRAIEAYLTLQYVPHPLSAFRAIRKLPPASTLVVTEEGHAISKYWSLDYSAKLESTPVHEIEELLWAKIREATRIRLMSEVPLGAFLSGGIDSSAVVAAMAEESQGPVKTFSIGFRDADFDERRHARTVAELYGTEHHEFEVEAEALEVMPRIARHYGEPFGDSSAIPSFYLAEMTGRHVTVALNGDGGDESFAGYPYYVQNDRVTRSLGLVPRPLRSAGTALGERLGEGRHFGTWRSRLSRRARLVGMEPWQRHATWMAAFFRTPEQRGRLLSPEFRASLGGWSADTVIREAWLGSTGRDLVDRLMDVDVQSYLPGDLLTKVDIATMAHSVEGRSPFLDHELMEFAASLPARLKARGGQKKWILRSALRRHLPDEILERPKMGFSLPLARWFREELRTLPGDLLLDPAAVGRGYFRPGEVERMIREHHEGEVDHAMRIWVMLQLEMWHREVVEAPPLTDARDRARA
jgi:asparagine synthase (glutamine-hydrolysing)